MSADIPRYFWLLLVLVPVLFILWRRFATGRRDLKLLSVGWLRQAHSNVFVVKWFFSSLLFALFVVLVVFSLTGLRWGQTPSLDERTGEDIVLAFDISRSMLARDISPNRIQRSAAVARALIARLPGARFGVVIFKGRGVTFLPITEDTTALNGLLGALHQNLLSSTGTDIGAGIVASIDTFPAKTETRRSIVLFTDGGFLEGDAIAAALKAKSQDVGLFVVGAGKTVPVQIPLADGVVVRTTSGDTVTTAMRPDVIEAIAEAAEGAFFRADDPSVVFDLEEAVLRGSSDTGFRYTSYDRYRLFVALALLCLAVSLVVRSVKWKDTF